MENEMSDDQIFAATEPYGQGWLPPERIVPLSLITKPEQRVRAEMLLTVLGEQIETNAKKYAVLKQMENIISAAMDCINEQALADVAGIVDGVQIDNAKLETTRKRTWKYDDQNLQNLIEEEADIKNQIATRKRYLESLKTTHVENDSRTGELYEVKPAQMISDGAILKCTFTK
jgi:hypothetical protein